MIERKSTICDDWSHKFIMQKNQKTPTTGIDVSHFVLEMILILILRLTLPFKV